jgi:phosphate uptake regulator
VGDYTKNIVELAVAHPARLDCGKYEADTTRIEMAVAAMFHQIVPVMKQYDEARARTLIQDSVWIRKRSDEIVVELIKGSDPSLTRGDAVAIALYVRYLKRIGAHLMNVLSSVVNPFERIGFHVEEND